MPSAGAVPIAAVNECLRIGTRRQELVEPLKMIAANVQGTDQWTELVRPVSTMSLCLRRDAFSSELTAKVRSLIAPKFAITEPKEPGLISEKPNTGTRHSFDAHLLQSRPWEVSNERKLRVSQSH